MTNCIIFSEFSNPGAKWRGKPFWSWNGVLDRDELIRQIHVFKEMGMGGFFMHSRTGLVTEYLGDTWFELINACADKAEKLGMEAWLYDEDRWPSGTAGGLVTQNPEFRMKFVTLHKRLPTEFVWHDNTLAVFLCDLFPDGLGFNTARRIHRGDEAVNCELGTLIEFTVDEMAPSSFYNGFTYVDTMNAAATAEYIRLTHERYKERCGGRLGKSIKGIFTDEPHRGAAMTGFGISGEDVQWMSPWTSALPAAFKTKFGIDLVEHLPQLFLQQDGEAIHPIKWQYMEMLQELFLANFAMPLYDWCEENGIRLTGHMLHENNLAAQSAMQGSLMRFYEHMHDPGIDLLGEFDNCYWIAKQVSSVARQLGKPWVLSEMYGCTGWQFGFSGHKKVGDWQALFGVNVRCHHLSWYTMAGEAKRDYPASILHQSAWYKDYNYVETYFARLGVILAQGVPVACDVLVINPVESMWCQIHGDWAASLSARDPEPRALETAYAELFTWLAQSQVEFDYADEEMLARLGAVETGSDGVPVFRIGKTCYKTVLIGKMATIRGTTLNRLNEFHRRGGHVIFAGDPPEHVDALESDDATELASAAVRTAWNKEEVVAAVTTTISRPIEVLDVASGKPITTVFSQRREDGDTQYVVAMNISEHTGYDRVSVRIPGRGVAEEWNCRTGLRQRIVSRPVDGTVEISTSFAPLQERVFVLSEGSAPDVPVAKREVTVRKEAIDGPFEYTLDEPNVCVLDVGRYSIDNGPWSDPTEILQVDRQVRDHFGLAHRGGEMVQPWYKNKFQPPPEVLGEIRIEFEFDVEADPVGPIDIAIERPADFEIKLNGHVAAVPTEPAWWVDTAFKIVPLPIDALRPGHNVLAISTLFKESTDLEAVYVRGHFGVRLDGGRAVMTRLPETLVAGDVTAQGLPFYTGRICYRAITNTSLAEGESAHVVIRDFGGACARVGGETSSQWEMIAWPPHEADVTAAISSGAHVNIEVVLTRRNVFGPLHLTPKEQGAYGPGHWVLTGANYSESYQLYPSGLIESPVIEVRIPE